MITSSELSQYFGGRRIAACIIAGLSGLWPQTSAAQSLEALVYLGLDNVRRERSVEPIVLSHGHNRPGTGGGPDDVQLGTASVDFGHIFATLAGVVGAPRWVETIAQWSDRITVTGPTPGALVEFEVQSSLNGEVDVPPSLGGASETTVGLQYAYSRGFVSGLPGLGPGCQQVPFTVPVPYGQTCNHARHTGVYRSYNVVRREFPVTTERVGDALEVWRVVLEVGRTYSVTQWVSTRGWISGMNHSAASGVASARFYLTPVNQGYGYTTASGRRYQRAVQPGAPLPPRNLRHFVDGPIVTLDWDAADSGTPASSYVIDAGLGPGTTQISVPVGGSTRLSVPAAPSTYHVRVRGVNEYGASVASNEVAIVVPACSQAPPPRNFIANARGSHVALGWEGVPGQSYELEVGSSSGQADLGVIALGTATAFAGQAPAGRYFVRLRSRGSCGGVSRTEEVVLDVQPPSPPGTPTAFEGRVEGQAVQLSWLQPESGDPVQAYWLEVGTSVNDHANLGTFSVGAQQSLTLSTVPPGAYYVRVHARNAAGRGPATPPVLLTVP